MPAFERREYLERIAKTKKRMEHAGIDLLMISDPANMNYLSGYDGLSYYTPQIMLLALEDEEPVWIGRMQDVACATYSAFLSPENVIGYPEDYIGDDSLHVMDFVSDYMRSRGWTRRRMGFEVHSLCLTVSSYQVFQRQFPDSTFIDADNLVNWVRVVKSDQEVAYMRQAGEISDRAMQVAINVIEPGVRQCDAASQISAALISGTPEAGGMMPNGMTMPAGERTSAPHLSFTEAPYQKGESVNLEIGGNRFRYHCGLSRSIFLGDPPEKLANLAPPTVEGMAAALDVARAGVTAEEVEAAFRAVTTRYGYEKKSRIGYSIGIGYPGTSWVERTVSLRQGDRTILEPNMTIHMMLGMWMDSWGLVLSETFLVKPEGPPETFSKLPRQLFTKS